MDQITVNVVDGGDQITVYVTQGISKIFVDGVTITGTGLTINDPLVSSGGSGGGGTWGTIAGTLSNQTDLQTALNAKEAVANKSTDVNTDQASNTKYPSVKSLYDWAIGLFATITNLATKKTDSMSTNKLLGRSTAGTGAIEEITLGTGLSLSGTTLNASGTAVTPAALTKNDDTNVTLTLGGTPASALLAAVSLSLGWTGTLADARIASAATWNTKLTPNAPITGATKTKITYDANGLVTAGTDATTADINDSTNRRYVTDAQLTTLGNQSGTNTGDQDLSGLLVKANNLADLTNAGTARTNLGLGTLATQSGTFSGTSSGTNTGDETATRIAAINHGATAKTTLVDADEVTGQDSANSFSLIRTTWANVKVFLKTYNDTLYQATLVSGTNIKTINSTTLLGSGNIAVQPTLVSGTNIKTINSNSLLGTGDIVISAAENVGSKIFNFYNFY